MSNDVVAVLSSLVGADPHFQRPFSIAVSGSPWSAASDRRWFVAFKGPTTLPRLTDVTRISTAQAYMAEVPPADAAKVNVTVLRRWAGEVPPDGAPYDEDDQNPGILLDIVLDRRRLAKLLTAAPEGDVSVWVLRLGEQAVPVLGLATPRWRGLLAALDSPPNTDDDRFVFPPPPKNAIDLMDELPQD